MALSSIASFPDIVRIYRSTLFLPRSYVGKVEPDPWIASSLPLIPSGGEALVGSQKVNIGLHTSTGVIQASPPAFNQGVRYISLSLLYTRDHLVEIYSSTTPTQVLVLN